MTRNRVSILAILLLLSLQQGCPPIGGHAPLEAPMPQFPWPPPSWTERYVLPDSLVTPSPSTKLGDAFYRIREALRRAEIIDWSVYAIGDSGFAVATRPERIEDDGHPKPSPERWGLKPPSHFVRSLADYFRILTSAQPGRYRFMVLLVTARPVVPRGGVTDTLVMDSIARRGAGTLEWDMMGNAIGPGGHCEALIYEYARRSSNDPAELVSSSQIPPIKHLAYAGLWNEEQLR